MDMLMRRSPADATERRLRKEKRTMSQDYALRREQPARIARTSPLNKSSAGCTVEGRLRRAPQGVRSSEGLACQEHLSRRTQQL